MNPMTALFVDVDSQKIVLKLNMFNGSVVFPRVGEKFTPPDSDKTYSVSGVRFHYHADGSVKVWLECRPSTFKRYKGTSAE